MASGPASVPLRILDSEFDILLTKVINLVNYDAMISKPEARNQGSRDVMDKLQSLFVRYNVLINELGKSVRFSTGQRLEYIEELVEAMVGRLIELKNAMVDTSEWLFQYFQKIETMEGVDYGSSFMAIPEALKSRIQKQREKLDNVMTISGDWEFIDSSDDDMEIKDMERIVANHEFSRQRREDAFKYLNDYASSLDDSAIEFLQEAILKSLIYRNDVNLSEPSKKELTSKDIEKSEVSENEMTGKLDNPSSDYLQKYISLNNSLIQWMFESRALTGAFPAFPEEGMRALMKDISTLELMDIIEKPVKPKKEKGAKKEAKMKTDVTTNKYSANLVRINELTKEFKLKSAKKPEIADDWMKITESNDLNADVQFMDLVNANMSDQVNILQRAIDGSAKYPFKEVTAGKNIKPRPKKKRNINQRTVKGIMAELLDFGLIEYPLEFTLDDVKGVRQPMPSLELESGLEPMPDIGDIKDFMILMIAYPLLSDKLRSQFPNVNSILIAGPPKSGKKMVAKALCNSIGGLLINLSVSNLMNKYVRDRQGKMIISFLKKAITEFPPVIILIGEVEKLFPKKKKKRFLTKNQKRCLRIIKTLTKFIKSRRAMIIGTMIVPRKQEIKKLEKMFDIVTLMPRPSRRSRLEIWRHVLDRFMLKGFSENDVFALAEVTEGLCGGHFVEAIKNCLTPMRKHELQNRPLGVNEILKHFKGADFIFEKDENVYKEFYKMTKFGKTRITDEEIEGLT